MTKQNSGGRIAKARESESAKKTLARCTRQGKMQSFLGHWSLVIGHWDVAIGCGHFPITHPYLYGTGTLPRIIRITSSLVFSSASAS